MSFNLVAIGEVLWDLFPAGPQLGGAPANFAYHAHALGASSRLISRIGRDALGEEILRRFQSFALPTDTLQIDDHAPTGSVTVTLSGNGIPNYTINTGVAWDALQADAVAMAAVREADAICFGSLAQRSPASRNAIQTLLRNASPEALKIFDINLRQQFYSREVLEQSLQLANGLKLNDDELAVLAPMFGIAGSVREQLERLSERFGLEVIALTRGEKGSVLYRRGEWSDRAAQPVTVVDTVGAGDAFAAAMVLGLLKRLPLDTINSLANELARHVCSQAGAMPPVPESFGAKF